MNWERCAAALVSIVENPFAERGYEELRRCYSEGGAKDREEAVDFLIREKFHADDSNAGAE